jgi:hypothetical protein
MRRITPILFMIVLAISFNTMSQVPAFQWIVNGGTGGGSSDNKDAYGKNVYTDDYGNIYGTSLLYGSYNKIDTIDTQGYFGYDDFCVYSYRCDGSFRWVRHFGGGSNDYCAGIAVDGQGNVYVTGHIPMYWMWDSHFGDSTIAASNMYDKKDFIAKLDSSGHTIWISFPGSASTTFLPSLFIHHIELNNMGNPQVMYHFFGSCTYGGFSIPDSGLYLFDFDKTNGSLQDIISMNIKPKQIGDNAYSIIFDTDNSIYMVSQVYDTVFIGNDTISKFSGVNYGNSLLLKFDSTGNIIWYKEIGGVIGSNTYGEVYGKPLIYGNSIFVSGFTHSLSNQLFQGIPISNPFNLSLRQTWLIAKFDKNTGNIVSAINIKNSNTIFRPFSLGIKDNQIIATTTGGEIIGFNQNDTIKPINNTTEMAYPFVVSADTGLTHFNWGFATVAMGLPYISCMNVDRRGNIYVSGMMQNSMNNSAGQVYQPTVAFGDNFFIAKIAMDNSNCGCVYSKAMAEVVSFSNQVLTVKSTFTEPIDSAYWYWGDGDSTLYNSANQSIIHTYSSNGPYDVCLKTWNYCGVTDTCFYGLTSGINGYQFNKTIKISIFPNPATSHITIDWQQPNAEFLELRIYSSTGRLVQSFNKVRSRQELSVEQLSPGIYFLEGLTAKGQRFVGKFVKE